MRAILAVICSLLTVSANANGDGTAPIFAETRAAAMRAQITWVQRAKIIRQEALKAEQLTLQVGILSDIREMLGGRADRREMTVQQMDEAFAARRNTLNEFFRASESSSSQAQTPRRVPKPQLDLGCFQRCTESGMSWGLCESKCSF